MTVGEALEYFKHYIEGTDFSDGIDESDVTRRGLRENFAEAFSTVFDHSESEANKIYSELFPSTTGLVKELFVA